MGKRGNAGEGKKEKDVSVMLFAKGCLCEPRRRFGRKLVIPRVARRDFVVVLRGESSRMIRSPYGTRPVIHRVRPSVYLVRLLSPQTTRLSCTGFH